MDNKKPDKIVGSDVFRERKAKQLIQKWEYEQITEDEFIIDMFRLGYSMEVIETILESDIE
tara:strand:+ start:1238 stop:1420 length:183 start_codon:yes stop_codon:yes gene_type:complete